MLITEKSPLINVPSDLDIHDRLLLDAIRYSASIADMCYDRLKLLLTQISKSEISITNPAISAAVYSDAWSMIDASHRLRESTDMINQRFSGKRDKLKGKKIIDIFKAQEITLADFYYNTETATLLRNYAHHPKGLVQYNVSHKSPLWGNLIWYYTPSDIPGQSNSFSFSAGVSVDKILAKLPLGIEVIRPLGPIVLSAYKYEICLSRLAHLIQLVVRNIETQIAPQFHGKHVEARDLLIQMSINNLKFT